MMRSLFHPVFLLVAFAACTSADKNAPPAPAPEAADSTFVNPLLESGPDPWVVEKDGTYYFTCTRADRLVLYPTKKMSELSKAVPTTIYTPEPGTKWSANLWAPELFFLRGKWYMYFAADDGKDENHRMYVLENASADPLKGTWELKGQLKPATDRWAIDGSILEYSDQLYFLWSGWREGGGQGQQIYIAKMSDPYTINGDRVMLCEAVYDWEKQGGHVNEGPEIIKNGAGQIFMTYSASSCFTDGYCLGLLTLKPDGDPMNPADWSKSPEPVMRTSEGAFGPGHNGFFRSPDGKENWIIYHANRQAGQGCGGQRNPRIERFTWSENGVPVFSRPVAPDKPLKKPSGE
ncbi:MAG: glycoside hydrolase family 43 protein [Mucilaginibacter polytrichastri]|nr:glycoside hydrolase family 43 protein [Mucilaginibacter polytrichastri]